ncbi:AmmeMemoRadiSam system protein A [Uliginosibacterium sp. TH139]|uniref:AmmeMemoRadiSam system protein A n=1 Tax=Uliginosibacterium sp. TH139 TaxID=2067453 RepID=UPI000C7ADB25|nr:AmmeMemoRadiSam system protein A [Uliginosibacterium sp. TH139]PLK47272.1 AmmeMemoRadiSam system protein A [Uliginosibacterium sp. TH139]
MTSDAALGPLLLAQARAAIAGTLGLKAAEPGDHPALHELGASFVTLTREGLLRGCIGQLQPVKALGPDVADNARAAAFRDPRFAPLTAEEWPDLQIEVSVLGPVSFVHCPTEEDCLRQLTPFKDGVILASGARRATFLPQVWEQLPDPQDFIRQLLQKAGLPVDLWPADMQLGRYRVTKYKEAG